METIHGHRFEEMRLLEGPVFFDRPHAYIVWGMVPGVLGSRLALSVGYAQGPGVLSPSAEQRVQWQLKKPLGGRLYLSILPLEPPFATPEGALALVRELCMALRPVCETQPWREPGPGAGRWRVRMR